MTRDEVMKILEDPDCYDQGGDLDPEALANAVEKHIWETACPQCTHGLGFHCRTCWPAIANPTNAR